MPNGRAVDSDHYRYKLAWLGALRHAVAGAGTSDTVVCGDMNIAPTDRDVFDPAAYTGHTHVTEAERAALAELQALGLSDVVRERWPDERVFTYWDYRAGMFHQDLGMRIDLVLAGDAVAARVRAAWVDRRARKGRGPSDHAPVIVDLDTAPDGDIGPVVPPASAPATRPGGAERLPRSPWAVAGAHDETGSSGHPERSRARDETGFSGHPERSRAREGATRAGSPAILGWSGG